MMIVIMIDDNCNHYIFYHNDNDSVFYIENDDDTILEFWVEVGGSVSG